MFLGNSEGCEISNRKPIFTSENMLSMAKKLSFFFTKAKNLSFILTQFFLLSFMK
jgi:hypothetical protein